MALLTPLWMEAAGGDPEVEYSASHERAALIGTVFSREGVMDKDAGDLRVSQRAEGPNLSVDVAAGKCAIVGDDVSDQGTYLCMSTTPVNLSLPQPPPSGSRTHRVIAQVRDKLSNGVYAGYDWNIEVLEDTGTGVPNIPNSAISLATVTVASGVLSVVNGNIGDTRQRSVVGTPALSGDWLPGGVHGAYGGRDGSRPLTWMKNPDGWVMLSGWIRRSSGNYTMQPNQTAYFDGGTHDSGSPALPPEARPSGIRDFIGLTSGGFVHYAVYPNGRISFRFNYQHTITEGLTWFTFDGCTYRANAF